MRQTKISFTVHDASGDGRVFEIDPARAEAVVFGAAAPVRVSAPGVLSKHLVVLPYEGQLLAASASDAAPALLGDRPIGRGWTPLPVPCRVRVGHAAVDFFASDALAAPRPSLDAGESTAVQPLELPAGRRATEEANTSGSAPAPIAQAGLETTAKKKAFERDDSIAVRAAMRLRDDYKRLSTPKRLLVPIAAALLILVSLPGTSHGTALETARYLPAAAMASDMSASGASDASSILPTASSSGASSASTTAASAALAAPAARPSVLPSGRSLPAAPKTALSRAEKIVYRRAIDATLVGDFDSAYRLYDLLLQAHPDSDEIKAAHRVIAVKLRARQLPSEAH